MAVNTTRFPLRGTQRRSNSTQRTRSPRAPHPSDDEILGLVTAVQRPVAAGVDHDSASDAVSPAARAQTTGVAQPSATGASADGPPTASADSASQADAQNGGTAAAVSPELAQILDANPQLRDAWNTAQQFRAVFATPAAAQDAKNQLDELDGMFFSAQPGDQAALAARIQDLSPGAFHSLAQAMQAHSAKLAANAAQGSAASGGQSLAVSTPTQPPAAAPPAASNVPPTSAPAEASPLQQPATSTGSRSAAAAVSPSASTPASAAADPRRAAQIAFFHSANSAAVHQVMSAIETQVNHLLPAGVSAPTKTRIVGEIYRDLSSALGANRQLGQQLREAFRSGSGDAAHQQAIVSLVTGRAKQALPSIARRVINEWTHSVVSANHEKLSWEDTAAKRVDISGAGSSDGVNRKPLSPRDLDYKRLSDADILNL
jgi:hypothetical protein